MKKQFKKYYLLLIITLLFINSSSSQTDTLFWFAVPYGTSLHSTREANIVLTATDMDDPTNIIITQPYNPIMDTIFVTINPLIPPATADIFFNNAQLVEIMNNTYIQNATNPNPRISNNAIKIQADREITAYYEYQRRYLNNDIFSLKGTNAMGTDFWIPFQNFWSNHQYNGDPAFSQIIVAATKPNTEITVTFPRRSYDIPPGTYTFTLAQPGMTMMFVPERNPGDLNEPYRTGAYKLNGTHITSNEPIVVTVNDDSAEKNGWDFVGDQLVPLINIHGKRTVGLEYLVIKGEITNNAQGNEKVFVLATENNTTITYRRKGDAAPITFPITNAGTQRVIDLIENTVTPALSNDFVYIVASKPIYVFHVSGFIGEMGGALVPTIDGCTGSLDVTVVRAKTGRFFLTIMTHFDALNFFEISKNGGPFAPFLSAADFEYSGYSDLWIIKKSSYNRSLDAVAGQPTRIRNTRNYFHLGVINEGPGTCEYGYFSDFAEARGSAFIVESGTDIITQCYGTETQLKANGGLAYSWTPTLYLDDPTSAEPNAFLPVGIHTFNVLIDRVCFPDTTINTSVEVYENTESFFTLDENIGCAPFLVEINNLTLNADTFLFDFEDDRNYDYFANNSSSTTFTHTYQNSTSTDSIYTLKLLAYDKQKDCPDIYTKTIRVFPEIDANLTPLTSIGCNPLTVNFRDLSTSPTSSDDIFKWTFGDGESYITSTPPANVSHEFKHFNTTDTVDFDVELVVTSPYFCRDTARATVSVFSYLEGEFTIDTTFGCSPLEVTITNISAGEDQYTLDLGDGTPLIPGATFASLSHTYVNTTNITQTYTITLTVENDEGCTKVWTETVTVYPEIRANYNLLPNQYTGCNTQSFAFTNTSNASPDAASIYLWTFGDGSTSNLVSPTKVYNNATSTDQNYIFNLRAQSVYGCYDDTSRTITIYRAYADFNLDTASGCSPLNVNITNTSVGNQITNWAWDFGDATNSGLQNPAAKLYTNTSGVTQVRPLRLTVTGTAGCSTFKETNVSVYSSIDVSFTPLLPVVCDSVPIPFVSTINHGTVNKYTWNFGDNTSSAAANFSKVYYNRSNAGNITFDARLKVETAEGCKDSTNTTVTVRPYVNALYTIDRVSGCTPLTVDAIANQYLGNANYNWLFGDGHNPIGFDPLPHTYPVNPAPGPNANYTLRLNVSDPSGLCTDFMEKSITVYPAALADFTPFEVSGCNPFTIDFANTSSATATSTYLWDFGDFTTFNGIDPAPKTFTNETNVTKPYKIKLKETTNYGCTHTDSANIYVYRKVEANFGINISEGCSPVDVEIKSNSRGGTYRWFWNSQTGAGVEDSLTTTNFPETLYHRYINTSGRDTIFYLTLIAQNPDGCTHKVTREILVHSSITADFDFVYTTNACSPSEVILTNTSIGGGSYTLNWDFGNGTYRSVTNAVALDTIHKWFTNLLTTDNPFTVTMDAISENGCTDTHQEIVTVYSRVEANFNIPISQRCPDAVTQMFDNAIIKNTSVGNAANTYQWFIDGVLVPTAPTNKDNFVHDYFNDQPAPRAYNIRLVATNPHGCTSEKTGTITVFEYVDAQFNIPNPAGCTPLVVNFNNTSLAPPTNTNYLWEYGDNTSSGIDSILHEHRFYNESRITDKPYRINLTVTSENYCTDTVSRNVTVYHQPLAKFNIDTTSSCPPLVVNLDNYDSRGYTLYRWIYGDGNSTTINSTLGEERTYSYPNISIDSTQKYKLMLYVESDRGCWHMDSTFLNVFPEVIANFTYDPAGCSPFVSSFVNTSTSPATQFYWDFKDGSSSNQEDVLHSFVNNNSVDRIFNVKLTATSDYICRDTITKPVTVYAQPIALFNPTRAVQTFPDAQVQLNSTSNDINEYNYFWDFDDGLTSTSSSEIFHNYAHWGERNITFILSSKTSNCADTLTKPIVIYPPKVNAAITVDIDQGCEPLDVQFTAAASIYSEIYTYEWDFGDGASATGATPNHSYDTAGVYYVKLTARGEGGEDYEYRTIRVYKNPKANFAVAPKITSLNTDMEARVELFNLSECEDTLGCSYLWRFGDGSTSTERELIYNYTELGKYDITLVVTTNSQNCVDSIMREDEVTVIGEGEIAFPNAFTPNLDGEISCRVDGGYDLYSNDIFHPVSKGVVKYELLIYNRWGELIFKSDDLGCGWNGYIDGELAKQEVYVWKSQGKFSNGRAFEMAGDVTLIR
jgi:PKD repeat protein